MRALIVLGLVASSASAQDAPLRPLGDVRELTSPSAYEACLALEADVEAAVEASALAAEAAAASLPLPAVPSDPVNVGAALYADVALSQSLSVRADPEAAPHAHLTDRPYIPPEPRAHLGVRAVPAGTFSADRLGALPPP